MTDARIGSAPDYFKTGRPTYYKSTKMRSRTEAKVAAELDRLGMEWTYEGDAFASERGQYLPDFVVGELGDGPLVIEVKPKTEQIGPALAKMLVVWDTDPTAALVVITTDSPYQTVLEMEDGAPRLPVFAIIDMTCCGANCLLFASSVKDEGVLACPHCDADATDFPAVFGSEGWSTAGEVAESFGFMGMFRFVEATLTSKALTGLFGIDRGDA